MTPSYDMLELLHQKCLTGDDADFNAFCTAAETALRDWAALYYQGTPAVPDITFDEVEAWLRGVKPDHPWFTKVGSAPVSGHRKVKHAYPMGSLNKAQTESDIRNWAVTYKSPTGYTITEKADGISCLLSYVGGKLVRAATRGDGVTGEDITENVKKMKGVRLKVANLTGAIRGEIVMTHKDFEALNAKTNGKYSNPRNAAAGIAKRQSNTAECKYLTVVHYEMHKDGKQIPTKQVMLKLLERLKLITPHWTNVADATGIQQTWKDYVDSLRAGCAYDIDGLVVEVDDLVTRNKHGEHNGRPYAAVAYKFGSATAETTLRDVEWATGATGRITPVAVFDEVNVGGVQVSRASLAGPQQVEKLKLYAGCTICVARRNDVIPRVEANVSLGIKNG